MVICVGGIPIDEVPQESRTFYHRYPHLKEGARQLCSIPAKCIGPAGLLYISQREYAVTIPHDKFVNLLGTDDCTSCHMLVLRHTTSGCVALAHLDGSDGATGSHIDEALQAMLHRISELSLGYQAGRIQMHLVGGYRDARALSDEITLCTLNALHKCVCELDLVTCCVGDHNTVIRAGISWPVVYGLAVSTDTGDIMPATFPDKGPEMSLRGARIFTGGRQLVEIYDCQQGLLRIGPFSYEPLRGVDLWLQQSDEFLLQNFSTTPEVEPPHFPLQVRGALKQIKEHPFPAISIFSDSRPRYFRKDEMTGQWIPIRY